MHNQVKSTVLNGMVDAGKEGSAGHKTNTIIKQGSIKLHTETTDKPKIVDGGFSWVILTCSCIIMFLTNLMWASYGVYILEFREHFPSNKGLFAWMYAANVTVVGLTGLVAGPLVKLSGTRVVSICGSLIIGCGYVIGSQSTGVLGLFISFAVLLGMGMSFVNMATNVATQQYFEKKRAFANGILLAGSTLSIFVAPPVVTWLIQTFGWRGAFFIQGAVGLNAVPAGILLIPISNKLTAPSTKPELSKCEGCVTFTRSLCACYLFKNVPFVLIMLGSLLYFFAQHTPMVFTVARAVDFGISRHSAALVMSVWAITCMCGQVALGWLGDKIKRGPLLACSLFGAGAIIFMSIFCRSLSLQLVYGAIYGLMLAGYNTMKIPTLVDILGVEQLGAAQGINLLVGGIGGLAGPPVSNMIAEMSGDFAISFGLAGLLMTLSGLLMLSGVLYEPCVSRHRRRRPARSASHGDTTYSPVTTPGTRKNTLQNAPVFLAASINSINMC